MSGKKKRKKVVRKRVKTARKIRKSKPAVKKVKIKRESVKGVRKTFLNYEQKIDRLKQLRRELNALDSRGFKTEADIIRSKLKDPG